MAAKTDPKQWQEPSSADIKSGYMKWKRPLSPYDRFMEEQGIPIYRDIGVYRVQDLPLTPWKRMGGNGTFIQLYGTKGLWGMYVVEVPSAGALNVEKHLYEEVYLVVEGRGSTEVWREGEIVQVALHGRTLLGLGRDGRIQEVGPETGGAAVASPLTRELKVAFLAHAKVPGRRERLLLVDDAGRIHEVRGQPGQQAVARVLAGLLADSDHVPHYRGKHLAFL